MANVERVKKGNTSNEKEQLSCANLFDDADVQSTSTPTSLICICLVLGGYKFHSKISCLASVVFVLQSLKTHTIILAKSGNRSARV